MKRKKQFSLDKKDRMLLYLLDVNGRMSYSKLAQRTNLSKQLAKYRVERLQNEGFIKGYFTMIDTSCLGFTTFRVYLKLKNITSEKKEEFIAYLKKEKSFWAVILIAGRWDIALGISVEDIYKFYALWETLLTTHLVNIKDYKICVYSPIYHYTKAYIIEKPDESSIRILGGQGKTDFDQTDIKILIALSKNARLSLLEIAKNANISAELASYRIKKLQKKQIIQGYRAMIDVNKLGYEFYKAEIRLGSYDKIKSILHYCHQHPNIYQVDKTIGGETLEVEFHVKSLKHMILIIEEMSKTFPNSIESFDYITILSEEKTTYMPDINE